MQRILDSLGVPYAGSRAGASNLSLHKARAKEVFRASGIATPRGASFSLENQMNAHDMAQAVFALFGPPYIVKPSMEGAGSGILFVATIIELPDAIADVLDAYGTALVEEYLFGEEATVGVAEDFRGEELYVFPPVHIEIPEGHKHITYEHHEEGSLRHNVPSAFSRAEKEALARYPALQKAVDVFLYIYLAPLFLAHLVRQRIHPRKAAEERSPGIFRCACACA